MKFKFLTLNKINLLPKSPGVYAFKDGQKFLYIGKAVNIKERVKNHFGRPSFQGVFFINKAEKVGFLKTGSEIEALILEASLIKKHRPRYNVVWRDDKNYFFVGLTKEDFPRVFITHQLYQKSNVKSQRLKVEYVGPFVDGKSLKQVLKVLRKVFPYRTCRILPKRPCLWHQLGRCPGPCLLKSNLGRQIPSAFSEIKKECQESAKNLARFLREGKEKVLKDLKREMKEYSLGENFEEAAKTRNCIISLEKILSHSRIFDWLEYQNSKPKPWQSSGVWGNTEKSLREILNFNKKISRIEGYDVSNIQGQNATGAMVVFLNGLPAKNLYRRFKIKITHQKFGEGPNDVAMIREVLERRFQHSEWLYPELILIDGGRAQLNAVLEVLRGEKNRPKIISLAKRENKLFIGKRKKPLFLKELPRPIFNLILQLRDEAHRFAVSYHRKLRDVDTFN